MKRIICLIWLIAFTVTASAQQFKRIYLFDSFKQAKVIFKNKAISYVSLNYDASNRKMLFKQGEELMEMTNPNQIDTIIIGNRRFIPATRGFYEVASLTKGSIMIDWCLSDIRIGSKGALGSTTQIHVQKLKMHDFGLAAEKYTPYEQESGITDVYKRKSDNTYYIPVNGKMEKVKNLKQLCKLFPNQKEQIEAYAKECKTDMKQTYDALVLLDYVLGLAVH